MFKKPDKKDSPPSVVEAHPKGRLESTHEELRAKYGQKLAGRIFEIDIEEIAPYLPKEKVLPKAIHICIREILDDYLKEGDDFYFQAEHKKFGVLLTKANKAIADLKMGAIKNEISRVINNIHDDKIPKSQKGSTENKVQSAKSVEEELSSKGSLSEKPDEEEIKAWASQTMMYMSSTYRIAELRADIFRLAELITVKYHPVWYVKNKIITGYAVKQIAPITTGDYRNKVVHEDLAVLGAAIHKLRYMHENNQYALLIVPVQVQTICDNHTKEFYSTYCRSIEPELKKFLILQIKGIENVKLIQSDLECIKALANHCRSMIIDSGLQTVSPKNIIHINFHSYGFDASGLGMSEKDMFKLTDNFCEYYDQHNKETFIMGINTNSMLMSALGAGFTYISGEAISEPLDAPRHASYMKLEDIYNKPSVV